MRYEGKATEAVVSGGVLEAAVERQSQSEAKQAQSLDVFELEAQLDSGEWKGEAPRSAEELEAVTMLADHFESRLFHVERGERKKVSSSILCFSSR